MRQYLYAALGLGLVGCGSEPPAFVEKPVFSLNVAVQSEGIDAGDAVQEPLPSDTDMDAILADLDVADDDAVADGTPGTSDADASDGDDASPADDSAPSRGGELEPGDSDEWAAPDLSRPNPGEMKACSRIAGVSDSRLKIAGSKKDMTLSATDILVAKITGNQNRVELNFRGEAGASLAGICLFLAGNQAEADLKTNLAIARVLYTARGNQSSGLILVEEGGSVDNMVVDLSGNQAVLNVSGVENCPTARLRGNSAAFNCMPR